MLPLVELAIYFLAAIVISHSDLQFRIIRNRDLSIFLALGIIIKSSEITLSDLFKVVCITLICFALHLLFKGKIGAGDLKLFWVFSVARVAALPSAFTALETEVELATCVCVADPDVVP